MANRVALIFGLACAVLGLVYMVALTWGIVTDELRRRRARV